MARTRSRNATAAERTITSLKASGRLEGADESTVALVRTLASALDVVDPETYPAQLASLARCQLSALKLLRGQADDGARDNGFDDLLTALGNVAES